MLASPGFAGRVTLDSRERIPRTPAPVLPPSNQRAAITEEIAIVSLTGHKKLHLHMNSSTAPMLHLSPASHPEQP